MKLLVWINNITAAAIKVLVITMVVVMLGALSIQVLLRYTVGFALSWSEELSVGLFTWVVLLVAGLGVRQGFHVRMSLLIERLPPGARRWVEQVILLATVAVGGFLVWSGWRYTADTLGTISPAIGYPIALLHAAGMVSGVLIVLFALEVLIEGKTKKDISGLDEG